MNVTKANDLSPNQGSLTVVAGPPGLGKSHLAGTMAEYLDPAEILVIATLPREVNSIQYQKHNLDTVVVTDEDWRPADKVLKATGYKQLCDIARELRADEKYAGIILDNGTEAAEQAWHAALVPFGVGDPSELGKGKNSFAPYTAVSEKMEQLILSFSTLTGKIPGLVKRPKLVCIPWHVQPPKEAAEDGDESADERGQGAEYEGGFLPMIRGRYRRRLMAVVDNYVYANLVRVQPANALAAMENHFCIQVVSDGERHVKIGGASPDPKSLIQGKYLDVHGRQDAWRLLMNLMQAK